MIKPATWLVGILVCVCVCVLDGKKIFYTLILVLTNKYILQEDMAQTFKI